MMVKNKYNNNKVSSDEIDVSWVVAELAAHKMWFVISLIVAIISGFVYIKTTPEVYEASCSILIRETNSKTVDINDFVGGDLFGDQANIATEKGVLGSRGVMWETIKKLDLEISYINLATYPKSGMYRNQPFIVIPDSGLKVHPSFQDVPFIVNIIDDDKLLVTVEVDDDLIEEYEFSTESTW
jgi:uncharacterized protein involved in exopolysaccharide biosynthesis